MSEYKVLTFHSVDTCTFLYCSLELQATKFLFCPLHMKSNYACFVFNTRSKHKFCRTSIPFMWNKSRICLCFHVQFSEIPMPGFLGKETNYVLCLLLVFLLPIRRYLFIPKIVICNSHHIQKI